LISSIDSAQSEAFREAIKLRQRLVFHGKCLETLRQQGRDWTLVTEVDEFLTFNYKGLKEDHLRYEAREEGIRTKEDIIKARTQQSPLRNQLPFLSDQVTIADYIESSGHDFGNCIVLPVLNFSSVESAEWSASSSPLSSEQEDENGNNNNNGATTTSSTGIPTNVVDKLMTVRQRKFGRKEGMFTRTLLDVSSVPPTNVHYQAVESEHNPNSAICPPNGKYETTDYIASLFRLNKYVIGSLEAFVERETVATGDNHATTEGKQQQKKNEREDELSLEHFENATNAFKAYGYTDAQEMSPWIEWFVKTVGGPKVAKKLLFDPLEKAHKELDGHKVIKQARDNM